MSTQQKVISALLFDAFPRKLHPDTFTRISGAMAVVIAFVLYTTFVQPRIVKINATRGVAFARAEGERTFKHLTGRSADLLRNWLTLIAAAGLTREEYIQAQVLAASKVGFFGRATVQGVPQ